MLADRSQARLFTVTKTKSPSAGPQTVSITAENRAYSSCIYPAVQDHIRSGYHAAPRLGHGNQRLKFKRFVRE